MNNDKAITQLEGLKISKQFVNTVVKRGLLSLAEYGLDELDYFIKEIGNYHINGVQNYFYNLNDEIKYINYMKEKQLDFSYAELVRIVVKINSVINKSTLYLETLLESAQENVDFEMFEHLGGKWTEDSLKKNNGFSTGKELVQIGLYKVTSNSRLTISHVNYMLDLNTSEIYQRIISYKKNSKTSTTPLEFIDELILPLELVYYPDQMNRRVIFSEYTLKKLVDKDFEKIENSAMSVNKIITESKKYFKKVLSANSYPVLIKYNKLSYTNDGIIVVEDFENNQLIVEANNNKKVNKRYDITIAGLLKTSCAKNSILFGEMYIDNTTSQFKLTPITIVSNKKIIRL